MHTPAKGAGPNKGLGGSNPPFSASFWTGLWTKFRALFFFMKKMRAKHAKTLAARSRIMKDSQEPSPHHHTEICVAPVSLHELI